jgi:hypothetical protein
MGSFEADLIILNRGGGDVSAAFSTERIAPQRGGK